MSARYEKGSFQRIRDERQRKQRIRNEEKIKTQNIPCVFDAETNEVSTTHYMDSKGIIKAYK